MRNPIILLLLLVSFFGCKETENLEPATDVRIVSFSPGITQTLVDLGLSSKIVGRTAFCKSISKTIPVVGSYLDIDYERLLRLKPTHVLIQQIKTPKDKHLEHLSNREHFDLHYWKLDRVIDIQTMYSEASKLFLEEEKALILDFDLYDPPSSSIVILTQGINSFTGLCFGSGTYLDDVIKLLGFSNAIKESGWRMIALEDIARLKPEKILVVSDAPIKEESLKGMHTLGSEVVPFVHKDALIPSSQIVAVANALKKKLLKQ